MTLEDYYRLAAQVAGNVPVHTPANVTPFIPPPGPIIGGFVPTPIPPITPPPEPTPQPVDPLNVTPAYLVIQDERGQELRRFPLKEGVNQIGASDSATKPDVALNEVDQAVAVSRKHATLWIDSTRLTLMDTGSLNHTYVDDVCLVPHQPTPITGASRLRFANLNVRVVWTVNPSSGR